MPNHTVGVNPCFAGKSANEQAFIGAKQKRGGSRPADKPSGGTAPGVGVVRPPVNHANLMHGEGGRVVGVIGGRSTVRWARDGV